jgi:hypothetical protein
VKQSRDEKEVMDYLIAHNGAGEMNFHEMVRDGEEMTHEI